MRVNSLGSECQLTVHWQPTMLKFHKESDFHLPVPKLSTGLLFHPRIWFDICNDLGQKLTSLEHCVIYSNRNELPGHILDIIASDFYLTVLGIFYLYYSANSGLVCRLHWLCNSWYMCDAWSQKNVSHGRFWNVAPDMGFQNINIASDASQTQCFEIRKLHLVEDLEMLRLTPDFDILHLTSLAMYTGYLYNGYTSHLYSTT